ncbi:hypothetical protein GPA19_05400 [Azoarcus indigens]|uniref:Uncharacterized protein n=1 Tax=Azoarcus indigens TaxID=29545 RepID=A0A4R6DVA5_9RHOO|nr:hypothetical protein [Azoarcus indigens]NMG64381.1 hypothetical protein [Azoarcus indigens]TDN49165.1 hypothetical protein C7389_11216 [Azoarcus indigens]
MTIKTSTGLRNYVMASGSLKAALDGYVLNIYAGTEPATADAALGAATLLTTVSVGGTGTGVTFASAAADGVLQKNASEAWSGTIVAGGESLPAVFYRLQAPDDTGLASTMARRVQGGVGPSRDLKISSTTLVVGNEQPIDSYYLSWPYMPGV